MISESTYLKAAILASAMLHFAVLGYAHLADAPEDLLPFQCAPRYISMPKLQVIPQVDNPFIERAVAFNFEAALAPEPLAVEPEALLAAVIPPTAAPTPAPKSAPEPEPTAAPEPEVAPKPEPAPIVEAPTLKPVVEDKDPDSAAPAVRSALAARDDAPAERPGAAAPGRADTETPMAAGSSSSTDSSVSKSARPGASRPQADQKKLNHQYGMTLYRQINKVKSYPKFARRAGIEGRVLVAITVDRRGTILEVEIRKSSGHVTLDESALATIRGLDSFPMPPSGLTWQVQVFELPMRYSLN